MPKKTKLLSQLNPDINVLGRITIDIIRDDGGPWVYSVWDDAGALEVFDDLAEAVDYAKRAIEDSTRLAAQCEQFGKELRAAGEEPEEPSTRTHLRLVKA